VIIFKYLTKEVCKTFFAVTLVLLLIFMSNFIVKYLGIAAQGRVAVGIVVNLIALELPRLLGPLLPLSMYFSLLLTFGRLNVEKEMVIFSSSGLGKGQLFTMLLPVVAVVMVIVAAMSFWLTPVANNYREQFLSRVGPEVMLQTTLPGRFQESSGGKLIFYVEGISSDRKHLQNIFLAEKTTDKDKKQTWTVLSAPNGYQQVDKDSGENYLVATNGYRYEGTPGKRDYRIYKFNKYGVHLASHVVAGKSKAKDLTTLQLMKDLSNRKHLAEFWWRVSIVLQTIILAAAAFFLTQQKPRSGRFSALFPGILLYVVYTQLLFASRQWLEKGIIPSSMGMWWVHCAVVLFLVAFTYWPKLFAKIIHPMKTNLQLSET